MTTHIHLRGQRYSVEVPSPHNDTEALHLEYRLILTVLEKFQADPRLILPDGTKIYRDDS